MVSSAYALDSRGSCCTKLSISNGEQVLQCDHIPPPPSRSPWQFQEANCWEVRRKTSWLQRFQIIPCRLLTIPPPCRRLELKVVDTSRDPVAWPCRATLADWDVLGRWGHLCRCASPAVVLIELIGIDHTTTPSGITEYLLAAWMGTNRNEWNQCLFAARGGKTMPNKVLLTSTHFSYFAMGGGGELELWADGIDWDAVMLMLRYFFLPKFPLNLLKLYSGTFQNSLRISTEVPQKVSRIVAHISPKFS